MSEIWTAMRKEGQTIFFNVVDEKTKEEREERWSEEELPSMIERGGYPYAMGVVLLMKECPWRFRKMDNGNIYLDGPSIGVEGYHPIEDE